jgi:hypothetical protein
MSADYSSGRNKRRKTYGYERTTPDVVNVVIDNVTRSFDKNTVVIHRDFFLIRDVFSSSFTSGSTPVVYAEYDEDYISFNNTTVNSRSFNITFTGTPYVTLVVEPPSGSNGGNIITFLDSHSTTQLTVGVSAPYSGNVRYRAIYSATWPAFVQRNVLEPTLYYTASAGFVDLTYQTGFTASYTSVGSVPSYVFISTYDNNNNNQADVAFVLTSSYSTTAVSGNVSAPMTDRIYYMAIA